MPAVFRGTIAAQLRSLGRLWRDYQRNDRRYQELMRRSLNGPGPNAEEKARLDGVLLLRFLLWRRLVYWGTIWMGVPLTLAVATCLLVRVNKTLVTVDVEAKTVSFRVPTPVDVDWAEPALAPSITGTVKIEGGQARILGADRDGFYPPPADFRLQSVSGSAMRLSALRVPAGHTIILAQPYTGCLRLAVEKTGGIGNVEMTTHAGATILYKDGVAADSFSRDDGTRMADQVVFGSPGGKQQHMAAEMDSVSRFSLPGTNTNSVVFLTGADMHERLQSSILGGTVCLSDTESDSVQLSDQDTLAVHLVDTVKVRITMSPEGFRVRFQGYTDQLIAGPSEQHELSRLNKMPRRYKVLHDQYPLIWALLLVLVPVIASTLFGPRKTV